MPFVRWLLAAALSAIAAFLSVDHSTPVDQALPLIAAAVTLVAAVSYPSLMAAVPLLIVAEIAIPDERARLLAFGAVVALLFGIAVCSLPRRRDDQRGVEHGLAITLAAVALLRWIPADGLEAGREAVLLLAVLFLVVVLDGTALAVAAAVVTALFTQAVSLSTLWPPFAVILVAVAVRVFGAPRIALTWQAATLLGSAMLFFPWSGVAARSFPYLLAPRTPARLIEPVKQALAPGRELTLDVPPGATSLVVSGANVAGFHRGKVLGRMEPGGRVIRIGDGSDWGFLRREAFHHSNNPLPRDPAGMIRGYGYAAWVDGAGRIPLPPGASTIRVTADAALPPDASLQVEGFERAGR